MQYVISDSDRVFEDMHYTGARSALEIHPDGKPYHTFRTATVLVTGKDLTFRRCSFANTAGPGKTAAQAIVDTVSGRELLSGVAPGKGVLQDKATGLESRMLGEASSAACGMSIEAANNVVDNILHRYELNYKNAPLGKKFQECYDLDTLTPSQEYLDVYENAMHTISMCGMDF